SRSSKAGHRDGSSLEITNGFDLRLGKTVSRIDTGLGAKRDQISATETVQNHRTPTDRAYVELSRRHCGNDRTGASGNEERCYLETVFLENLFFYGNPKRSGRTCERRIGNDHFAGFRGIHRGDPETRPEQSQRQQCPYDLSSRHRNVSFRHALYSLLPPSFDTGGGTLFCRRGYFVAPHRTGLADFPHPALQLPSLHRL